MSRLSTTAQRFPVVAEFWFERIISFHISSSPAIVCEKPLSPPLGFRVVLLLWLAGRCWEWLLEADCGGWSVVVVLAGASFGVGCEVGVGSEVN